MRIWVDCEFNEFKGELISMALVAEDGQEWYRSLGCKNPGAWVAHNVMPIIGIDPVGMAQFQVELRAFLAQFDAVNIIADWPEDIAHFCQTLITGPGSRLDTPPLTMEVVRIDAPSELPHNALADARGIRNMGIPRASLLRDAARYRWLRKQDVWTTAYGGVKWSMQIRQAPATEGIPFIIKNYGTHLDAALDAAIATSSQETASE